MTMPPVAILAGGLSTRMHPATVRTPKALLEIAGKPFAEHQLDLLRRNGITDVVFCVGHLGEQVVQCIGNGNRLGVRVRYSFDGPELLGTGGALVRAASLLHDRFFILYGDSYLECDYSAIAEYFVQSAWAGLMTVFRNEDRWDRSNVEFEAGQIVAYDKSLRTARMRHIDYGLGMLQRTVLEKYRSDRFLDLADIYQDLIGRRQLTGFEVGERFYEVGSPAGFEQTQRYLERSRELREGTSR
jgi:NDP-sugar pyrophosphorylase family protein